ncbi:SphA family protein [Brevundimonas sp. Root1279]|uniref:SphA family protein n=1 Tax=Brevundimonas sp. Root1279 TaxID=1736443 RepID=UPI0006F92585|nr:transporter [Brevundimonas sp. Root1279]KQW82001.1 phenol degradation protein meta [Brevundimonas sp. Root1279]
MRVSVSTSFLAAGAVIAGLAAAAAPDAAQASEGGASFYLLGSGGPGVGMVPPLKGTYFANSLYYYSGSAGGDRQFPVGGNVVLDLDATIVADFATVLWVPSTDIAGATLAVGLVIPFGEPDVTVSGVVTGPLGNSVGVSRSDSAFVFGDPVATAMLGWSEGKTHLNVSATVNIPVGDYREDQLANLSFNRWAVDTSVAATWHDPDSGWDVSGKVGVTFNGENEHTQYETGTELHVEGSVEKAFSKTFSAGLQAYHFDQLTGDSGPGSRLGPFKGRVTGLGATAAWNFEMAHRPASLRLRAFKEFNVENRLEGESLFLDFSIPLVVQMPPGAGGG